MKKEIFLVLLLLILQLNYLLAQEVTINGKIEDKVGPVSNANIVNKKTQQGTFSDDKGLFSIKVKLGQKLVFTSIQHHKKTVLISDDILQSKSLNIVLYTKDYLLEEVTVSNKKMFGTFKRSFKQTTRDIAVVKSRNALDFSNVKVEALKNYDKASKNNRDLNNITDPTQNFEGANLGGAFLPFKSILKKQKERKRFKFKESFPKLLLKDFGERFFFNQLKIPENKYYHFLETCNPLGIEKLYQDGRKLELMQILMSEAKMYVINNKHK